MMSRLILTIMVAIAFVFTLFATRAFAEPVLGLEMERTAAPVNHGDERLVYELTVKNEASANPKVGDELTCKGAPEDGVSWSGNPVPTFTYAWLRDGAPIPLEMTSTYTLTSEDAGKSMQCVVMGTNDPDGAGIVYDPIVFIYVSLAPVVVEPEIQAGTHSDISNNSLRNQHED